MLFNSRWITYKTGKKRTANDKYGSPAAYFRTVFLASCADILRATLFVSALGVFKAYLNGEAVSCDYLSPGWVDYRKKLPFIQYDITDKLRDKNAVGIIIADGWAVGHLGSNYAFKRCGYSDRTELTALIRIEYKNGQTEDISSDGNWRASSGAIRRSDIYMGEFVDSRLDLGDFSKPDYDDNLWGYAEESVFKFSRNLYLEEVKIPPIVTKYTFVPTLISKKKNTYLYDVGQNIAGVLSVNVKGDKGAKIVIRHGELINNEKLYTENLRKAESTDTYILSGKGIEKFRPLFTYHGFQYAEIKITGKAEICSVIAEAMYTDLDAVGTFSCSNDIVNKIYQNALWSQRDNFLNVPTDCPQRDERLGWTADAQIFAKSAMWNMDCRSFYEKYLSDVRDAQLGNGVIPCVAPLPPVGSYAYTGKEAAAGWCEVIAQLPYDHFTMYGDKRVIRDNLPSLKKLIGYYEVESPTGIRSGEGAYGDWLSLGTPSDLSVISTLYYARAVELAAWMCSNIGDSEENYYKELLKKIKSAFRRKFVDNDGKILSDTQSVYVIAYKFGVISKSEVTKQLNRKFEETGGKLTTGFLGIKFLLPTLCDIGRSDIAYSILTSTDFPGWGYSIKNGATTIWEHWDSYTIEDGIRKGMNSFNHYSFGSCVEWMYEYCLGIRSSAEGGFKKVVFAPAFDKSGKITSAEGSYDSEFGKITAAWKQTNCGFEYVVRVPLNVDYTLDIKDAAEILEERKNDSVIVRVCVPFHNK